MVSPQYSKASISTRNKPGAYIIIFTGALKNLCSKFSTFVSYTKKERRGMKDERTHYGTEDKF